MAFCAAMAIIAPQVAHAQNVASSAALEARLKHLKNFGISTAKLCKKQKDGSWSCETKQYATMCDIRFQCKNYPYDSKAGKITDGPIPETETGFQGDIAVPPRDKMPPVIGFLGMGRICDNRRPDGPCWNVPLRWQANRERVTQPLERLSNTACPAPGAQGAQDCKPMARLSYCVSTTGCHILLSEATDLGPPPQSAAAKPPPACASIHVNGQSACDIQP
jgi:hypothetical protein